MTAQFILTIEHTSGEVTEQEFGQRNYAIMRSVEIGSEILEGSSKLAVVGFFLTDTQTGNVLLSYEA